MSLELQFKIKNDEYCQRYLRENSYWYKLLNRDPNNFKTFENEVKDHFKLKRVHKIEKTIDTIGMIEKVLSTLN